MAKQAFKVRAKLKDNTVTVKALLKHPMETGLRKDKKTGKKITAHHITEFTCHYNNSLVFSTHWGPGVSKDPFISFGLKGIAKGEVLTLAYVDNREQTASIETKIK